MCVVSTPRQFTDTDLRLTIITSNNVAHDPQCCSHHTLVIMPEEKQTQVNKSDATAALLQLTTNLFPA